MLRLKNIFFFLSFAFLLVSNLVGALDAKEVSLEVMAVRAKADAEMTNEENLLLNGFHQAVTAELEEQKLDSALYWSKLELKKLPPKEEIIFLKAFFENTSLLKPEATTANAPSDKTKINAIFKANLDPVKLKSSFEELTTALSEAKLKTFYLISDIEIDKSMNWDDVGVSKPENFSGVVVDSWKKLLEKEIKGFEKIETLEKDLAQKPDYLNPKSVTLKWNSLLKKTASNPETGSVSFELSAQYVLQNTKSGNVLSSFDFPVQKRDLNTKNKKALSSSLASLIYNSLLSQITKIQAITLSNATVAELAEVEIKLVSKSGLSEIYQINDFLQTKFKDLKLQASLKTYEAQGSILLLRAEGSAESILETLSKEGGKFPLNEQKILIFNRIDKTFAILPKESNN